MSPKQCFWPSVVSLPTLVKYAKDIVQTFVSVGSQSPDRDTKRTLRRGRNPRCFSSTSVALDAQDYRAFRQDARDSTVSTTVSPIGESTFAKGAHHPHGLGQGPGQGDHPPHGQDPVALTAASKGARTPDCATFSDNKSCVFGEDAQKYGSGQSPPNEIALPGSERLHHPGGEEEGQPPGSLPPAGTVTLVKPRIKRSRLKVQISAASNGLPLKDMLAVGEMHWLFRKGIIALNLSWAGGLVVVAE